MKPKWYIWLCATLVACAAVIPALLQDGNLAITALTTLSSDTKLLGAPPVDTIAIDTVTSAVQAALADLKKGVKTSSDFAQLINDQISQLAPTILKDLKANSDITTGVVLLQQLVMLIAAEATAQQTPTAEMSPHLIEARANMQDWLQRHHK